MASGKKDIMTTSIYKKQDEFSTKDNLDKISNSPNESSSDNTLRQIENVSRTNSKSTSSLERNTPNSTQEDSQSKKYGTFTRQQTNEDSSTTEKDMKISSSHSRSIAAAAKLVTSNAPPSDGSEDSLANQKIIRKNTFNQGTTSKQGSNIGPAMEELRQHYESEIALLKRQVQGMYGNSKPSEEALMKKCHLLERQLKAATNDSESLKEQVKGLRVQLKAWPNRVIVLEEENEKLRDKLEELRHQNREKGYELDVEKQKLRDMEMIKWENGDINKENEMMLQRMMDEYDQLEKDYNMLKSDLIATENKLYSASTELADEKRRSAQLELEIQRRENEINSLKRTSLASISPMTRFHSSRSSVQNWYHANNSPGNDRFPRRKEDTPLKTRKLFASEERGTNRSQQQIQKPIQQSDYQPAGSSSLMTMSCYGGFPADEPDNKKFEYDTRKPEKLSPIEDQNFSIFQKHDQEKLRQQYIRQNRGYGRRSFSVENPTQMKLHGLYSSPSPNKNNQTESSKSDELKKLENRYDELQMEKRTLENQLSHIPSDSSARNKRMVREQKELLETKLDHVDHELGSLKMALKQLRVLK